METIPKKISGEVEISQEKIGSFNKEIKNVSDFKKKIKDSFDKSISEVIETILGGAISLSASDAHIEPEEETAKLRIRIDGILLDVINLESKLYNIMLSRIKLLSGIKINISDRPQDGRFSVISQNTPIEIRVSTLPAEYGEAIVLRVLNPKNLISLHELGLREDLAETFKNEIKRPNGMIIVTGPTGSGKTTTLYAFLKEIQKPEIKIITIEDPIEYHLEGISQTQAAPEKGYDFANGLKSLMRQDPDVILVGEIRDLETAKTAIQAALTGHFVLTTLHTNDAAGTIARLQALGEEPANIAPAINMVIAQRLLRKVCLKCAKLEKPSENDLEKIKKILKKAPKNIVKISASVKIPKAVGCKYCNFTGYRNRIGIFEALIIGDEMEKYVLTAPSIVALREKAVKEGMLTMYQDGIIKVLEGVTTMEELERVTGE